VNESPRAELPAGLYLVGTPIGNLEDITLRALRVLQSVSAVYCEDTRHTRGLLERHSISTPLVSCHGFNEASRRDGVVRRIEEGAAIAMVSDAGMPGVSDPGARLCRAVRDAGLPVHVIPGPSAVTHAASLSGWTDDGFVFCGFMPQKSAARRRVISSWKTESRAIIFFESVHRIIRLLDDLCELLPARRMLVGRELTKTFEDCSVGLPDEVRTHVAARAIKGEFTVVLAPLSGAETRAAIKDKLESEHETVIDG